MKKYRRFLIKDIDCEVLVRVVSQKEVLSWMDDYIEKLSYELFDGSDCYFNVLYKDGSFDFINGEYDGHNIKRHNIVSLVFVSPLLSMVYGNFDINEFGVVTPSFKEKIAVKNIMEIIEKNKIDHMLKRLYNKWIKKKCRHFCRFCKYTKYCDLYIFRKNS